FDRGDERWGVGRHDQLSIFVHRAEPGREPRCQGFHGWHAHNDGRNRANEKRSSMTISRAARGAARLAGERAMFNKSWRRLRSDERGMSMVFVSIAFMSRRTATTLAIDVGMFMTARAQAQNAADAGALAGATALGFNSFTDRTASGPAVTGAVNTARAN